ncbi:MAG TPA: NUDIX hydrolase [Vicinamibacterales bacterium]|nr:NUDIX hydrolase [Vicinamibacterales bacterium]
MTRQFPSQPVVGVGAVILHDGRVLLGKRGHEPLKGQWSLPGGAVEVGETLEAAVAREIVEETGLRITVGPVIEVFDRITAAADGRVEYHFVLIDYLCTVEDGAALKPASDVDALEWAAGDELAQFALSDKTTSVVTQGFAMFRAGAMGRR